MIKMGKERRNEEIRKGKRMIKDLKKKVKEVRKDLISSVHVIGTDLATKLCDHLHNRQTMETMFNWKEDQCPEYNRRFPKLVGESAHKTIVSCVTSEIMAWINSNESFNEACLKILDEFKRKTSGIQNELTSIQELMEGIFKSTKKYPDIPVPPPFKRMSLFKQLTFTLKRVYFPNLCEHKYNNDRLGYLYRQTNETMDAITVKITKECLDEIYFNEIIETIKEIFKQSLQNRLKEEEEIIYELKLAKCSDETNERYLLLSRECQTLFVKIYLAVKSTLENVAEILNIRDSMIEKGAFGCVYQARASTGKNKWQPATVIEIRIPRDTEFYRVFFELTCLMNMDHKNVLRMYGYSLTETSDTVTLQIITELCDRSLEDFMETVQLRCSPNLNEFLDRLGVFIRTKMQENILSSDSKAEKSSGMEELNELMSSDSKAEKSSGMEELNELMGQVKSVSDINTSSNKNSESELNKTFLKCNISQEENGSGNVKQPPAVLLESNVPNKLPAAVPLVSQTSFARSLQKSSVLFQNKQMEVEAYYTGGHNPEDELSDSNEDDQSFVCTIEVHGLSSWTYNDTIEFYFENTRRSGGGKIDEMKREGEVVYITFEDEKVVQRVLGRRKHVLDGVELEVKQYTPPPFPNPRPVYENNVFISGMRPETTEDSLSNVLEAKTSILPSEIRYGEDEGTTLVTFEEQQVSEMEDLIEKLPARYRYRDLTVLPVQDMSMTVKQVDVLMLSESAEETVELDILLQRVKITNPKFVNKEAEMVMCSKDMQEESLSNADTDIAREIIQKHCSRLFQQHRNLNIISMSPIRSKNGGKVLEKEFCIVLYCFCKGLKPLNECRYPTFLECNGKSLPVDVREGYFEFCPKYDTQCSTNYHKKLRMGCGFGMKVQPLDGTVGPFLKVDGGLGFLTCAHVTFGIKNKCFTYTSQNMCLSDQNGMEVEGGYFSWVGGGSSRSEECFIALQPSPRTFTDNTNDPTIGEVCRGAFKRNHQQTSVDAAIVKITNPTRVPERGEFAINTETNLKSANFKELPVYNGSVITDPTKINTDARFVKFGSTTHATRGTITSLGCAVVSKSCDIKNSDIKNGCAHFFNQYEIGSLSNFPVFIEPGDSGSGVFQVEVKGNQEILHLIGLAVGLTSFHCAIVTPIKSIMDELGIDEKDFDLNST